MTREERQEEEEETKKREREMKLSDQALVNLSNHKYSGIDDSLLAYYVLRHYWNYCVELVPLWVAPNLITLTGTIGIIISFLIVGWYTPNYEGILPTWVYLLAAAALFFYQTMDNVDGKQARRTGSSSPLGQLFDHGCDSVVCTFQAITAASIGSYGSGYLALYQIFVTTLMPFWLATWEEYHTGVLHLGKINGPDEGIIIVVLAFLGTAVLGGEAWITPLGQFLPESISSITNLLPSCLLNCKMNVIIAFSISIPTLITCVINIMNVVNHLKEKKKPIAPALKHILVWVMITSCAFLWYYTSTSFYGDDSIWIKYPRTVHVTIGLIFGELVSRLILCHMCHEKFSIFQKSLVPMIVMTCISILRYFSHQFVSTSSPSNVISSSLSAITHGIEEQYILILFTLIGIIRYSLFVKDTIQQLCSHLKIKCFKIPYASNNNNNTTKKQQ
ncbi:CDP-alcohol phosphatidyltransferase [Cavenderia fasciculata]|uniref:CDP-alcohol phosphatidyltransferase n=1 Tax=Cavenderia fasciculata TaxID=261658 RepID=F4PQE4_CACFS|nr:CDP-alcohol phosphatidyltransferase [Cavenderia fasciculata]EGG22607.1 CDP-alcohol phosphatidyltransferase [Cavenderia fasciculata]|eukprot:XP_004360458.1 CDP-alcohol phosphatidyltransferase [Cavenderia fasciculata]